MANNNVIEVPSNDAFKPYRGTDEQIQAFPVLPGAVYFAYDTNKIYFDEAGGRHVMSGSGIKFVYGAETEAISPNEDLLYPFPREAIQLAYAELGKPVETYSPEDIIINVDGTLYRIKSIDEEFCYCIKLLVSGSGGGGGDDNSQFYISYNVNFPDVLAKGQDATATLTVVDMKRARQCTLYVELYENDLAVEPFNTDIVYTNQPVNAQVTITIPANKMRVGLNNIRVRAAASGRSTEVNYDGMVNVVDIHMRAGNSWNWLSPISNRLSEIMFPYSISGFSDNDVFTVNAKFVIDEENGGASFNEQIKNTLNGSVNLYRLFQGLGHGAHTIDVYATTVINGAEVQIDDNAMHYEVAYYDPDNTVPIIWSTYRHNTTEKNYSVINIPFMVFQVGNQMNKLTVTYFVNDEEISSEDISMSEQEPATWEVPYYNPEETNTFIITAGEADPAVFNVYIEKDNNRDMDSISTNCILHLSATGRSNNESSLKRQTWPNGKKTVASGFVGEVQLQDFNWYNNGWVKDDDGITVLRVSNGAQVFIPITLFNGSQSRQQTYEFDFKVRNAVDYSRLINLETVYQLDGNGEYILDPETNKPMPELNELGDEKVVRTVAAGGRGAFLQYYANNKGIMCGTQEAFIGINSNANLNVRYTDDVRVKISFVVDTTILNPSEGKALIYAYVDGVLTGVMDYDQVNTNFEQNSAGIRINSNYCDVDLYEIRAYNTALSFNQITQNWVGGSSTAIEREHRYERNQAISKSGGNTTAKVYLDYEAVRASNLIPVMVFTTYDKTTYPDVSLVQNELPFFKGDESIPVRVRYYDPENPNKSFHCQNVQLNVQGTSSQGYPRRNYKLKIKKATDFGTDNDNNEIEPFLFETWDGIEANKNYYYKDSAHKLKKINIGSGTAETKFCLKADYMDSSSSHNTPLANLVSTLLSTKHSSFDLQHPLVQHRENSDFSTEMLRVTNNLDKTVNIDGTDYTVSSWTDSIGSGKFRTTVYGFPILCYFEDPVTGEMTYIGKYNFNLDKSATDTFGFTNKALNPFSEVKERSTKVTSDAGDQKIKQTRPGTYEEISECWELRQNQAGLSKFQDGDDFWALDTDGRLTAIGTHFEARYHNPEIDPDVWWNDNGGIEAGNEAAIPHLQNLYKLWDWIRRTDVTTNKNRQYSVLDTPVYYKTLSKSYEPGITYYSDDQGTEATITRGQHVEITAIYDVNGNNVTDTIASADKPYFTEATEQAKATKFITYLNKLIHDDDNNPNPRPEYYGPHSITYVVDPEDPTTGTWTLYGEYPFTNSNKFGITNLYSDTISAIEVTMTEVNEGFSANLYEKFTRDSNRYRLAKFRNEFKKHLNLDYCLMYFVLTELLLLYDSRQKNMMIASFGPEEANGEFIWYPIFYDMDTQLGVNNSGQVYWDYDEDATPDLYMETLIPSGWDGEADVKIKSHTNVTEQEPDGNTDSIFSGNGSVLWNNIYICFLNEIKSLYREMRNKDLNETNLNLYYNTNSCDKWSEIMKNLDAYFKYIAPAIPAEGFINQSGNKAVSSYYFYCLQGDRKLNRQAFFRNRLNYIDSEWLGGNYDPTKNRANVQMRYNLNDRRNTSDQDTEEYIDLNSTATYKITPYLSQYVSVRYDQSVTTPQKFKLVTSATGEAAEPITVEPPANIKSRADGGVALSQQLAYVEGPQFISSLGDLSLHYLNEFKVENATRLRELKLGNEDPKYFNKGFTALAVGEKGLLRSIDVSNLSELNNNLIVTGCDKLEILKCLGTSIADVSLPRGSVLRRVYLPGSLESLILIKPLVLDSIITSKSHASGYLAANNQGYEDDGLYVENLTDKLNANIDGSTICKIQKYQVVDTKLGYATYNMLKYLYEVKLARASGIILSDANATRVLRIDVEDADWTPYKQLEVDAVYDDNKTYYYRNDNCTYSPYTYSARWQRDLLNGRLYEENGQGRSPVTSLTMLDRFIADFDDPLVSYADCQFKPVQDATGSDSATTKRIPIITGKIHVQNDQDHPIKESDIANKYQAANHFPDLDITAEYVVAANRVTFIEYDGETSARKVLASQKCDPDANATVMVVAPQSPSRLHYDFLGWVLETPDGTDWQAMKSVNNEWDMENNQCVDPETFNLADPQNASLTFVAVYSLHQYTVTYFNYDGTPFYWDGQPVTSKAVAGTYITFTSYIPWRDDRYDCALKETWHFDGWRTALDTEDLVDSYVEGDSPAGKSYIRANKDINLYARYTKESVYEHPLTAAQLVYTYYDYSQSYGVTIRDDIGLTGKICFPKSLTIDGVTGPVTSLLTTSIDSSSSGGPLANRHDRTNPTSSYYAANSNDVGIYAVFFEGTDDDTATMQIISESTFENSDSLVYIDFPDSITEIGSRAFAYCANLTNNELPKHILTIGAAAFNNAWTEVPGGIELKIPAAFMQGYNGRFSVWNGFMFYSTAVNSVDIGSRTDRIDSRLSQDLDTYAAQRWFIEDVPGHITFMWYVKSSAGITESIARQWTAKWFNKSAENDMERTVAVNVG